MVSVAQLVEQRIVVPKVERSYLFTYPNGRMVEWPMAPSWKGGELKGSVGSNPTSSSIKAISRETVRIGCAKA